MHMYIRLFYICIGRYGIHKYKVQSIKCYLCVCIYIYIYFFFFFFFFEGCKIPIRGIYVEYKMIIVQNYTIGHIG